ncbi:MAG: ribosome biogenesis factor YjgA [Escherichia coli]|nr:ribosome biogenesis factor YjgA [Escherichia coli]
MTKQPEDWLDDVPGDDIEDEDDEIIWVSKSEIKRDKMEGRRRQLQLIGKMLRQRDVEPIRQALDKLKNRHNQQVVLFHKLENLRDRLIEQGDDAIAEVLNLWPDADRQQLRTLIRNAKKEKEGNKPPKSARQIFQYLRELAENEG